MIPLEINFFGIYVPGMLLAGAFALFIVWILEGFVLHSKVVRRVWHPHLFRLAVYMAIIGAVCLFAI